MRLYKELRSRVIEQTGKDPYRAWLTQRANAGKRGVPFRLSFEDWWVIWEERFSERGRGSKEFVMCRHGDAGGYESGNVRIGTANSNHDERTRVMLQRDIKADWDFDGEDRSGCADWLENRRSGSYLE